MQVTCILECIYLEISDYIFIYSACHVVLIIEKRKEGMLNVNMIVKSLPSVMMMSRLP